MPLIQTILVPTDFSRTCRGAFPLACSLARDNQARLILLHVMLPSAAPLCDTPPPDPLRSAESQSSLKGRFSWPESADPRLRVEHRVAEGDAATEILRLAQAERSDLIVMGTHARTGLGRWWMGSVAEEVMRKAACPVLIVKPFLPANASATAPVQSAPVGP